MKTKKIIAVLAAAALTLQLAACGGTGGGDFEHKATIDEPWWTTTGTLNKDSDGKIVYDNVTIRMTHVIGGTDMPTLNAIVDEFEDTHPGITIVRDQISEASYEKQTADAIMNNLNAPDLILSHQRGHKNFADNHLIQPFDEAIEASGITISMNDYSESLAQYSDCDYDGYLFGVPVDARSNIVFYNKDMLSKYELTVPQTHEELLNVCSVVAKGEKAAGNSGFLPIRWEYESTFISRYTWTTCMVQNGASFFGDMDGKKYRANWASDPDNLKAFQNGFQAMRDIVSPQNPQYAATKGAAGLSEFLAGNFLFFFTTPWGMDETLDAYRQKQGNISFDELTKRVGAVSTAGWFALDPDSDNAQTVFGDSHFFAMSRTVTDINKKAAICEFVKWFTQTPSVGARWGEVGHYPACTLVTSSEEFNSKPLVKNYLTKYIPDINKFQGFGCTPYYDDTFGEFYPLIVTVPLNTTAAQDASVIRAAANTVNNMIDFIETDF